MSPNWKTDFCNIFVGWNTLYLHRTDIKQCHLYDREEKEEHKTKTEEAPNKEKTERAKRKAKEAAALPTEENSTQQEK